MDSGRLDCGTGAEDESYFRDLRETSLRKKNALLNSELAKKDELITKMSTVNLHKAEELAKKDAEIEWLKNFIRTELEIDPNEHRVER